MSALETDSRGLVTTCAACGQRNRVAFERLQDTIRCGQCQSGLTVTAAPLEVTDTVDFDRLVTQAAIPVIVDYWAPWCGPCRMVAPELEKVAARANGRYLVIKVNTDALPDLGGRYAIRSIPTLAVFSGGREAGRTTGARPAADIEAFVAGVTSRPA